MAGPNSAEAGASVLDDSAVPPDEAAGQDASTVGASFVVASTVTNALPPPLLDLGLALTGPVILFAATLTLVIRDTEKSPPHQ